MGHLKWKYAAVTAFYFLCIVSIHAVLAQDVPQILNLSAKGELGKEAQLSCSFLPENATAEWMFKGATVKNSQRLKQTAEQKALLEKDLDGNIKKYQLSNLTITNLTSTDAGDYICIAKWGEAKAELAVNLDLSFPARLLKSTDGPIRLNATDQGNVTLVCSFEIYNGTEVKWWKRGKDDVTDIATQPAKQINIKKIESTLNFNIKRPEDNGTYFCQVWDDVTMRNITGAVDVIVYSAPKVMIDTVKAISASQLYLNWTVHAYNLPIKGYNLMYRKLPSSDFNQYTREKIGIKNTSFVLEGLDNSTEYQIKLEVTTSYGSSNPYVFPQIVRTLEKDPVFVPNISINGFSATSVTIGWAPPPDDIAEYIHYYLLEARKKDEGASKRAFHSRDNRNLPYMFDDLEPHSTYVFRVCSCSEFTRKCGNWSSEMEAVTLDGVPGAPSDVTVTCSSVGRGRALELRWQSPRRPNAEIKGYSMELIGNSTYKDRLGNLKIDTWGPFSKHFSNETRSFRADDLQPNTNYTARLSAMTRTRRRGEEQARSCRTPPAAPDAPPRPRWKKIVENNRYMFKTIIPRMSERNGPICCYRVYMVRLLPQFDWKDLPPPKDINIISYEEAHAQTPSLGAYVTDLFSNDKYPPESELIMGDDGSFVDNKVCKICLKKPKRAFQAITIPTKPTTQAPTTKEDDYDLLDEESTIEPAPESVEKRERRSYYDNKGDNRFTPYLLIKDNGDYWSNPMMMDGPVPVSDADEDLDIKDGPLDPMSNYTLFVELIADVAGEEPLYSEYLNALAPAPGAPAAGAAAHNALEIVLQVTCGILALVLLGMVIFCIMHTRKARKMPPHAHVEGNPLQAAFRYVVEEVLGGGRAAPPPPDLPPIPADALPAAYAERQADSDYGFQKEFELLQMLPDCLPERTTLASEARENQAKNRYPDIKAYDQTRVKLSIRGDVPGSDYINANYVMGYKERKQFICAQGPTETTVNDFWRMIWEHGLELVVMLTNLEEYSKVKCSQYWPEDRGSRAFGACQVTHVREKRYSDYIVRELKVKQLPTNADGQPIVENNGVKRNGDCTSSAPTSPREKANGDASSNERTVIQYHFLMWKDFAAPEHAHSILKFIKRVNEAWSSLSGRPIVVHCSAGVGRTGTLVALDCLLEQLRAEGKVAVFNTVRELREQRNFLVQSLKQYVFVYRALVEYAYYGDTEIPASKLKSAIDRLRNTPEGADKCLMEHEFEKMLTSPVTEPVKSCSAGAQEEVRCKNRSQDVLPYDRNRVILTPVPSRDFSTYINASFIEAYDNSEGFIITQDPLPNTIPDFWRMVAEHGVSTIVMLSEIGEGERKCPRYWDDGGAAYEQLSVAHAGSESLPYYTRRQFTLTNNKNGETSSVRHLQYHGWPTAPGHVPEVTRGLAELADAAAPGCPPLAAHCTLGAERAPLFVALCSLISQLRCEKRVDVACAARVIRAQRATAIGTFLQYEFLHRAILNYAELHNLMEDS